MTITSFSDIFSKMENKAVNQADLLKGVKTHFDKNAGYLDKFLLRVVQICSYSGFKGWSRSEHGITLGVFVKPSWHRSQTMKNAAITPHGLKDLFDTVGVPNEIEEDNVFVGNLALALISAWKESEAVSTEGGQYEPLHKNLGFGIGASGGY